MDNVFAGMYLFQRESVSISCQGYPSWSDQSLGQNLKEYIRYKKTGWIRQAHQRLPRVGGLTSTFTEEGQLKACSPFLCLLLSLQLLVASGFCPPFTPSKAHFFCLSSGIFVLMITGGWRMRSSPTNLVLEVFVNDKNYRVKYAQKKQSSF